MQHDVECSTDPDLDVRRRRDPNAVPGKSAASANAPRRAARPAASCSSVADTGVGPVERQRQVAGAGVGVVDHVGERGMQRLPLDRVEAASTADASRGG